MALPRWISLSLHLRERARSLLFTAAWLPGQASRRVHHRRHPPRVSHREELRSALHRLLRTSDLVHRSLARAADYFRHAESGTDRCGCSRVGQDGVAASELLSEKLFHLTCALVCRLESVTAASAETST